MRHTLIKGATDHFVYQSRFFYSYFFDAFSCLPKQGEKGKRHQNEQSTISLWKRKSIPFVGEEVEKYKHESECIFEITQAQVSTDATGLGSNNN